MPEQKTVGRRVCLRGSLRLSVEILRIRTAQRSEQVLDFGTLEPGTQRQHQDDASFQTVQVLTLDDSGLGKTGRQQNPPLCGPRNDDNRLTGFQ